jgi:dihydropteroate synthase
MAEVVRRADCSVVLMRSQDIEGDIVAGCRAQLQAVLARARLAGIPDERIIVDPGLGFGSRPGPHGADNLALVDGIADYADGHPVLVGASRKRFVGELSGTTQPSGRVTASVAIAVRARNAGAAVLRVHDVAATVRALA